MLLHCPEIYANLCVKLVPRAVNSFLQISALLAPDCVTAIRHQQDERENREILTNLIGWQLLPEFESFPGSSPGSAEAMSAALQFLVELIEQDIRQQRGEWPALRGSFLPDRNNPTFEQTRLQIATNKS